MNVWKEFFIQENNQKKLEAASDCVTLLLRFNEEKEQKEMKVNRLPTTVVSRAVA